LAREPGRSLWRDHQAGAADLQRAPRDRGDGLLEERVERTAALSALLARGDQDSLDVPDELRSEQRRCSAYPFYDDDWIGGLCKLFKIKK
jgi:hypothetical protein